MNVEIVKGLITITTIVCICLTVIFCLKYYIQYCKSRDFEDIWEVLADMKCDISQIKESVKDEKKII